MIDQELLSILVCPENKSPVHMADEALIANINARIEAGTLKNRRNELVDTPIDAGLIREDGAYLYIIRDEIPIMLVDEAVPLEQLAG